MLYSIITTHADGHTTQNTLDALNAKQAHTAATEHADYTDGATVRVYPTTQDENGNIIAYNVLRGALMIAKRSAEKSLARTGGTETQKRIADELTAANAKAGADGAEKLGAAYILDMIARLSADSQDIFGYAYSGILDGINNGAELSEQYHNGYLSINAYIMTQRAATQYELSTEFITANGGELVSLGSYLARLIKSGDRYTPIAETDINGMDAETADRLGAALKNAAATLTPRQKDIATLTARGYSQRQVMETLKIKNVATVAEHLAHIRKKYLAYITDNAPEFLPLIKSAEVNAVKTDRHADTAARRIANAEKMRRYRQRKKALANANK